MGHAAYDPPTGQPYVIQWSATDAVGVSSVDVRVSLDDGAFGPASTRFNEFATGGVMCQPRIALKPSDFLPGAPSATIKVMSSLPLQFLLVTIAGWMTRDNQRVTEYLLAENAVLREHRL